MVFKWLRAALSSSKKLIGSDQLGNKYYEGLRASGKVYRFVENNVKPEDYSSGELPLEWEAWIRGKRIQPPTQQEIDEHMKQTATVLQRAALRMKEDNEKQAKAFSDGLIMKERSDDSPAKQATAKTSIPGANASSGSSRYQPDSWTPGSKTESEFIPNEPEAWTPGSKP